jgi:hypothetical protein
MADVASVGEAATQAQRMTESGVSAIYRRSSWSWTRSLVSVFFIARWSTRSASGAA